MVNNLSLAILVGLWLEAVSLELEDHEGNGKHKEPGHVSVEAAWHGCELAILNHWDDFQLTWVSTSHEGDTSDDGVSAGNWGGNDDCGPAEREAEGGANDSHEDDEDPEDNLAVGVDLVHERVVQDEGKCDSAPACSHGYSHSEELGKEETTDHAHHEAHWEKDPASGVRGVAVEENAEHEEGRHDGQDRGADDEERDLEETFAQDAQDETENDQRAANNDWLVAQELDQGVVAEVVATVFGAYHYV